jgi:hypothetical protein
MYSTPCRLGRRSPAYGNVRGGPTAMSFIRSTFFFDTFLLINESKSA